MLQFSADSMSNMAENDEDIGKKDSATSESNPFIERATNQDAEKGREEQAESEGGENKLEGVVKPDGGWGWMVCLGAFICNFVVFGTHNSFGVIYGTLIRELKISSAETGKDSYITTLAIGCKSIIH